MGLAPAMFILYVTSEAHHTSLLNNEIEEISMFAFPHMPEKGNKTQTFLTHFLHMILFNYQIYYLNFKCKPINIFFVEKTTSETITVVEVFSTYYFWLMEHNPFKGSLVRSSCYHVICHMFIPESATFLSI